MKKTHIRRENKQKYDKIKTEREAGRLSNPKWRQAIFIVKTHC